MPTRGSIQNTHPPNPHLPNPHLQPRSTNSTTHAPIQHPLPVSTLIYYPRDSCCHTLPFHSCDHSLCCSTPATSPYHSSPAAWTLPTVRSNAALSRLVCRDAATNTRHSNQNQQSRPTRTNPPSQEFHAAASGYKEKILELQQKVSLLIRNLYLLFYMVQLNL